jgi:hypothetical protein
VPATQGTHPPKGPACLPKQAAHYTIDPQATQGTNRCASAAFSLDNKQG